MQLLHIYVRSTQTQAVGLAAGGRMQGGVGGRMRRPLAFQINCHTRCLKGGPTKDPLAEPNSFILSLSIPLPLRLQTFIFPLLQQPQQIFKSLFTPDKL